MFENRTLNKKNITHIIYCLLNRIPILVMGSKSDDLDVDFILEELSYLIHYRQELVFNTDFIHKTEYESLIENEFHDNNSKRIQIRCPSDSSFKALTEFDNFKSWLIGFKINKKNSYEEYLKKFRKKFKKYLLIKLVNDMFIIECHKIDIKKESLKLEEAIINKISKKTEKSVTGMKRVLTEKIRLENSKLLEKDFIKDAFDFSIEEKVLKKNIFRSEIQNFYAASKRAFFILFKLKLLSRLLNNFETKKDNKHMVIGNQTLLNTIDYYEAPVNRILSFIRNEWGEDFRDYVKNGKKNNIGDIIIGNAGGL